MKKFAKICLITTLALVIAGALFLGSGLAIGGTAVASEALSAVSDHSNGLWGINFLNRHHYVTPDDDWDDDFF